MIYIFGNQTFLFVHFFIFILLYRQRIQSISTSKACIVGSGDELTNVAASGDAVAPFASGALKNACAAYR